MAKHKKTKQQKIISDLRRKLQSQVETKQILSEKSKTSVSKQIPEQSFEKQENNNLNKTIKYSNISSYDFKKEIRNKSHINNYSYVVGDLKKTGILTGSVIIAQLILFYLLKTHIIVLPMVRY